ncbi:hypothetical protein PROFUN_16413 [Planoprotostelium fungivorum]|uniref:Uncharacterized protein n=1 Tax=Planoprotostelium fungivorum TaxID=1890364 RepID=A0A2P6MQW2_9EUKA|nr:hypothetical protein PROFUN_16413 [Planoprotostelium fungivorum]
MLGDPNNLPLACADSSFFGILESIVVTLSVSGHILCAPLSSYTVNSKLLEMSCKIH